MSILRFRTAILLSILAIMSICITGTTYVYAAKEEQRIFDDAGLLTSNQLEQLEAMCVEYGEEAGIDIYILTHDNPKAKDGDLYIEDFADKEKLTNSVILLIDLQERDVIIQGYGTAETYIHSERGDIIRENITPYLTDGDYSEAFDRFIKQSAAYMKDDSFINDDHDYSYDSEGNKVGYESASTADDFLNSIWFRLIVSLVVGGIAVAIMAYQSGGKMTAGGNTYMDASHSGLIGRRDIYLRTTVSKVRKPQNNTTGKGGFNAGGFRGGISSGGRSHSSSRGKF